VIEAVMFWNEPNNMSHWDFGVDPDWSIFASMVRTAGAAVAAECPGLTRVLGGISPIDAGFVGNMDRQGVLGAVDAVAVHGFPLDWNHWMIDEWPAKLEEIRTVTSLPIWISEVGVSTFGAEEVQEFGLRRSYDLLEGRAPRVHWYSLFDLPKTWPATTRHREAEGSSYYRHFYMGLLREDGTPKRRALPTARPPSGSVSGSTSRITVWTRPWAGCGDWASGTCVRDSAGPTRSGRARPTGSIGRCAPSSRSTSPSPSASRPKVPASARTTRARRARSTRSPTSAPRWSAATPERSRRVLPGTPPLGLGQPGQRQGEPADHEHDAAGHPHVEARELLIHHRVDPGRDGALPVERIERRG
jgi:hypothetical protein